MKDHSQKRYTSTSPRLEKESIMVRSVGDIVVKDK